MLSKLDAYMKCMILLVRESQLKDPTDSRELVERTLDTYENDKRALSGGESIIIDEFKRILKGVINRTLEPDANTLLQTLRLTFRDKVELYEILEDNLSNKMSNDSLKKMVFSIREFLTSNLGELEAQASITKAYFDLVHGKFKGSVSDYCRNLGEQLITAGNNDTNKDPAIMSKISINDTDRVSDVFQDVIKFNSSEGMLRTGFKGVNKMLGGGFRRGEMWVILALQHNYKSGFTMSIFCQMCQNNTPFMKDKTKKPLMLFISLENEDRNTYKFIYEYLYFSEFKTRPDISVTPVKEMAKYIKEKLTATGYNVEILRVNPNLWNRTKLENVILEYESMGYEIHSLVIDYFAKIPVINDKSANGVGLQCNFEFMRNFCTTRAITFITPHQLSTEANTLFRGGLKGYKLLDELVGEEGGRNYYAVSKQISHIIDGEIYLTKGKHNKDYAIYLKKAKHRDGPIITDDDKKCMLLFPKDAPIPEDLNSPDELMDNSNENSNEWF